MDYEAYRDLLKEFRDNHKYSDLLNVLVARYEITLIKYRMLNNDKYKNVLDEFITIFKWNNEI